MELDQTHLQLIFNVVAITAITSLATICHLLKRENEALTNKLNSKGEPGSRRVTPPSSSVAAPKPGGIAESQPDAPLVLDIRQFVTKRAQGWSAPSESQWRAQ